MLGRAAGPGGFCQAPASGPSLGWVSNSVGLLQELSKWADNAEIGPHALARAMLRGLRIQLICIGEMGLSSIGVEVAEEEHGQEEVLVDEWAKFQDNITGARLDNKLVYEARNEKSGDIRKRGI